MSSDFFDLIERLAGAGVDFVIVDGFAGIAHGCMLYGCDDQKQVRAKAFIISFRMKGQTTGLKLHPACWRKNAASNCETSFSNGATKGQN